MEIHGMWRKSYYAGGALYMVERENGTKMYYDNGKIHRFPSYKPAIIYSTGTKAWLVCYTETVHPRLNGNVVIDIGFTTGPAVEKMCGKKRWYIRFLILSKICGVKYTEQEYSSIVFHHLLSSSRS
jgi:hypothetical protein